MRLIGWICSVGLLLVCGMGCKAPPAHTPLTFSSKKPSRTLLPFRTVSLQDDFWRPKLTRNADVSWLHLARELESYAQNFARAAGIMVGGYIGNRAGYADSEIYKLLEAAAYLPENANTDSLFTIANTWIGWIEQAQDSQGYLQTRDVLLQDERSIALGDIAHINQGGQHRLYNLGHLYEAAAAWREEKGDVRLWKVAEKSVHQLYSYLFFTESPEVIVPGHQEIELGLLRMAEVSQDTRYKKLAAYFLLNRGIEGQNYPDEQYSQQHAPLQEQYRVVGHSVRALYQYQAMSKLGQHIETPWQSQLDSLWDDLVAHHLYLTGGTGALAELPIPGRFFNGWEGFGKRYQLPHDGYAETCAGVALINWAGEMWIRDPDASYFDVVERVLYNQLLSGVAQSGKAFFYQNHLCAPASEQNRRKPLNGSCCPTNLVRLLPQISKLLYAKNVDTVYVNLYAASEVKIPFGGDTLHLRLTSSFPWTGNISVEVLHAPQQALSLQFRIPGWARNQAVPSDLYGYKKGESHNTFYLNDSILSPLPTSPYLHMRKRWQVGDRIQLNFDMPVRMVSAHPSVASCQGQVAFERGAIVYTFEGIDQPIDTLTGWRVGEGSKIDWEPKQDAWGRHVRIRVPALRENKWDTLTGIPYFTWANRDSTAMKVWLDR